jgi:hypothetical protein
MTEVSIVFLSRPEDTAEQMTATVGCIADHIEASNEITRMLYLTHSVWQCLPIGGRRPGDGDLTLGLVDCEVAIKVTAIKV